MFNNSSFALLMSHTEKYLDEFNSTDIDQFQARYDLLGSIILILILSLIIISTIFGNILVIIAIMKDKTIQNLSNYLIVSLASTDLIVACFVMPISAINELSTKWFLGVTICDIWIILDVMSCSACILNLVCIALDRYWLIIHVEYKLERKLWHLLVALVIIWLVSVVIAIPSRYFPGRNEVDMSIEVSFEGQCNINSGSLYTLFSTIGAFYLPMGFIICIYWRIYRAALRRIRRPLQRPYEQSLRFLRRIHQSVSRNKHRSHHHIASILARCRFHIILKRYLQCTCLSPCGSKSHLAAVDTDDQGTKSTTVSHSIPTYTYNIPLQQHKMLSYADSISVSSQYSGSSSFASSSIHSGHTATKYNKASLTLPHNHTPSLNSSSLIISNEMRHHKLEMHRERKASVTVLVITSCFIFCWLPFFLQALIGPFIPTAYQLGYISSSILLWLGYINCLLNPFIYTFFSSEFKAAFKQVLSFSSK